jgi:cytochrome c oxidase subunit I
MKKTENILLVPMAIMLGITLFSVFLGNSTVDIHLHDTLFVISQQYISSVLLGLLIVIYGFYKIIRQKRGSINKWVAFFHIIVTLLFIVLVAASIVYPFMGSVPRTYIDANSGWFDEFFIFERIISTAALSFLLSQLIFIIYFAVEMIRPRKVAM